MLSEGTMDRVLEGAKIFGEAMVGRPDLAMKIGAALTASDVPQEIVNAITSAYRDAQEAVDAQYAADDSDTLYL